VAPAHGAEVSVRWPRALIDISEGRERARSIDPAAPPAGAARSDGGPARA
jgi:hypothetical protein